MPLRGLMEISRTDTAIVLMDERGTVVNWMLASMDDGELERLERIDGAASPTRPAETGPSPPAELTLAAAPED